ncbi:hypothetical protein ASG99_02175 [Bacillus sp. Soil768D1]|nr:hypothetical protein ASG99_02175 [Bacillus sp. Soil768D1]
MFVNKLLFNIDNYKKKIAVLIKGRLIILVKIEFTNDRIMGNLEGDVVVNTRIEHKKRHLLQSGIQVIVG